MSFTEKLESTFSESAYNKVLTENGAVGYKSTMNPLLDMNFKVASYRHMSDEEIISDFIEAYNFDKVYALKWLFYSRDIRQGLGERRLFRVIMKHLAAVRKEVVIKLLPIIAEYGRWDDLIVLYNTSLRREVTDVVRAQLDSDKEGMKNHTSISLLAKWLPSVNTSSKETVALAKSLASALGMTEKEYRKMLSSLRAYLKIVEVNMSSNKWGDIDYEAVPSKANILYKEAFLKQDKDRRLAYLKALREGKAKINSSVNFPHDIVHNYNIQPEYGFPYEYITSNQEPDITLEELWKALPDYGIKNTIVVADGSGSMGCRIGISSSVTALEVANALAIYCAQHTKGRFAGKYITFSERPQLVNVNADSLFENLKIALAHNECANTNIEAVFNLILKTAVKKKISPKKIPRNILIISDMEFDAAAVAPSCKIYEGINHTLFKTIGKKYAEAGYKLPRLVFWNVNSRSCAIPLMENEAGVALVSGFSPVIIRMVMSGKLDPYECLKETLDDKRYNVIGELVSESA